MAKEYWVNVYDFTNVAGTDGGPRYQYGYHLTSKIEVENETINWGSFKQIPIYRIHVKMKEPVRYTGPIRSLETIGKNHIVNRRHIMNSRS